jgi:hypothetical protein
MSGRVFSPWILLGLLTLSPAMVEAEDQSASGSKAPPAPEAVGSRLSLEDVAKKLDDLQEQLRTLAGAVKALQQSGPAGQDQLVPVEQVSRSEFDALAQLVYEQVGALGDIARRISEEGDKYVLNLRSAMAVPQFREELTEAVHDVIRRRGTLRVENRTAVEHRLLVNRTEYRIPAMRTLALDVPVGTVTTELLGYERPKNWTVSPPHYHQRITITRTAPPAVFVAPPVVVEPPIYVGPPVVLY